MPVYQKEIFTGYWGNNHCQGIAVDQKKGFLYVSFTTLLLKMDLQGNLIGSVDGLVGHLGCIALNEKDGKVYGSLEFKNDIIGRNVRKNLGVEHAHGDVFYTAIFDVDKIDRMDMSAEKDGVMKTVCLKDVAALYKQTVTIDGTTYDHRYGVTGIDGCCFGRLPGGQDEKEYLLVSSGCASDVDRPDNNYQMIAAYDVTGWWDTVAKPLDQFHMHQSGPDVPEHRFFLYTGNTRWGIQNFVCHKDTGDYYFTVYRGAKPLFPNYDMFVIDGKIPPKEVPHECLDETITVLSLKDVGQSQNGVSGYYFPYGAMGLETLGGDLFYIAEGGKNENGNFATIRLYRKTNDPATPFVPAE